MVNVMEYNEFLFYALNLVLTILVSVCSWLVIDILRQIKKLKQDYIDIRFNYLDRFTSVHNHLAEIKKDIAVIINRLDPNKR